MNTQLRTYPHEPASGSGTRSSSTTRQFSSIPPGSETEALDPPHGTDQPNVLVVPDWLIPVVDAISTVSHHEIDVLLAALQQRNDELREARARRAVVGKRVLVADIVPRYLEGLVGDVEETDGEWVSIRLTEQSTGRLRFCGQSDYYVGSSPRFLLTGVPAWLCFDPAEMPAVV